MTAPILTLNDSYPGRLPPGTRVVLRGPGHNHLNVEVRVPGARMSLFISPKWIDWPEPEPFKARKLHVERSVLG